MPRIKTIKLKSKELYKDRYKINNKYEYDTKQLDKIIQAIEFYSNLCDDGVSHQYRAAHIIIRCHNAEYDYDQVDNQLFYDNFNISCLSSLFKSATYESKIFYHWTQEQSQKSGNHYHILVIGNFISNNDLFELQDQISNKIGGMHVVEVSPRLKTSLKVEHPACTYFHNLFYEKSDAIERYCYLAKLSQKANIPNKTTFGGSRELRTLDAPINKTKIQLVNNLIQDWRNKINDKKDWIYERHIKPQKYKSNKFSSSDFKLESRSRKYLNFDEPY